MIITGSYVYTLIQSCFLAACLMQHAVKHGHVLPYELDAARCYKLMNMGTSHAIRPARQTPNALLDTATYFRSHNELDTARCYDYMNIWTSHAISRTGPQIRLSVIHRETETVKT